MEQNNNLIYVAYTLDKKTMNLGVVESMHPEHEVSIPQQNDANCSIER